MSAASSGDRDDHVATVPNVLPLQENEISHATGTSTKGEGDGTVGSALEGREEECSMLSLSSELKQRRVQEENVLLATDVIKRNVRAKNLKQTVGEEQLNEMEVLREPKCSKKKVKDL